MGTRGPVGQNREKLIARGSKRVKKTAAADPLSTPPVDAGPPLGLDGVALAVWMEIVPKLIAGGTLQAVDRIALGTYCTTHAQVVELRATLKREGLIVDGRAGIQKPHPALRPLRQAEAAALALAREIGLTPASRGRIPRPAVQIPKEDSILRYVRMK